jgi:uncharacterized membrane protein
MIIFAVYCIGEKRVGLIMSLSIGEQSSHQGLSVEKLSLFSDAVFAIAITLLAIDIRVPLLAENLISSQLSNEIVGLAPKFISFILSFFIVGSYWMIYHRTFRLIKRYDQGLIFLNLLFLMFVVLLPFPNDLIGKYPTQQIAVVTYAIFLFATGISLCLLWVHASKGHRLIDEILSPKYIRTFTLRLFISPGVFLISIAVSFLNPLYCLVLWSCTFPVGIIFNRMYLKEDAKK